MRRVATSSKPGAVAKREWRARNAERSREINRAWQQEKRGDFYESLRKYKAANRHIPNELNAKYRAAKLQATPTWVDHEELRRIYRECPKGYHVDHIVPLNHPEVCGLHVPWNLQYLPALDNQIKGNRLDQDMASSTRS